MKVVAESDKFGNPFKLTKALAYIYEKESLTITQFKTHLQFTSQKADSYIRRLKVHEFIEFRVVGKEQYIERKPLLGKVLAVFFLRMVDTQWIKKNRDKKKNKPQGGEVIFLTEKFLRLCREEEEILLRIEPKLEKERFL